MADKTVDRWTKEGKAFKKALEELGKLEVRVGYQEGATYPDGTPVINVALWNELGTVNIPPRPFIRQTVDNNEAKFQSQMKASASKLAKGTSSDEVLNELGVFAKGLLQKEIKDGGFIANAPSTVKKKGSDKPLIDTGLLRQSANYVIKKKGGQ